jgi:hypothetical protein
VKDFAYRWLRFVRFHEVKTRRKSRRARTQTAQFTLSLWARFRGCDPRVQPGTRTDLVGIIEEGASTEEALTARRTFPQRPPGSIFF